MDTIRSYMSDTGVSEEEWERIFGKKVEPTTMEQFNEEMRDVVEKGKALLSEEEWDRWFPEKKVVAPKKPTLENGY